MASTSRNTPFPPKICFFHYFYDFPFAQGVLPTPLNTFQTMLEVTRSVWKVSINRLVLYSASSPLFQIYFISIAFHIKTRPREGSFRLIAPPGRSGIRSAASRCIFRFYSVFFRFYWFFYLSEICIKGGGLPPLFPSLCVVYSCVGTRIELPPSILQAQERPQASEKSQCVTVVSQPI